MSEIQNFRKQYHQQICEKIIFIRDGFPNMADSGSRLSKEISQKIVELLGHQIGLTKIVFTILHSQN